MKAFVTGGNGFIGRNLINQLVEQGWEVFSYDNAPMREDIKHPANVTYIQGSITDSFHLAKCMPAGLDAVFHIAGNTSLWSRNNKAQYLDNVIGTRYTAQAALTKKAKKFIYTSSYTVYGFHDEPVNETTVSTVVDSGINYFLTKAEAEGEVRQAMQKGLYAVILNPANVMGPFDYRNWSELFVLISQEKLPGAPFGKGSFCHVKDVARAHIAAFHKGRPGENYLLGGVDITYLELIQEIGRHLQKKTPQKAMSAGVLKILSKGLELISFITGKEPDTTPQKVRFFSNTLCCSYEKAAAELDFNPAPLEELITDTATWLKQEKFL